MAGPLPGRRAGWPGPDPARRPGPVRFPKPLRLLAEGLALRTPVPSAAQVHRQVTAVAKQEGWPVPSYSWVYAIVCGIDPALRTLAVEGTRRYAEVFELVYRRQAGSPNEIWQADHTQLDLWVVTPAGQSARPWLTVIEDDYSRAIAGYAVNLGAPSALQTALALRQAIWRKAEPGWHVCGIPAVFHTDHGLAELDVALGAFIVTDYNNRVHSETGQPPQARWEAGGFLPRLPESLDQLDLLLLTVAKPRKVHPDGIRFQGLRYLDPVLAAYVGESVIIRYDPRDLAEIRVFHHGRFLTRAICPDLAATTVSLKEITAARSARRRELNRQIGERASVVDRLIAVHAPPPPSAPAATPAADAPSPRLKRYREE